MSRAFLAQLKARPPRSPASPLGTVPSDNVFFSSTDAGAPPPVSTASFAPLPDTASSTLDAQEAEPGSPGQPPPGQPIFRCSTGDASLAEGGSGDAPVDVQLSQAQQEVARLQKKLSSLQLDSRLLEKQIVADSTVLHKKQEELDR